ncbi:hypothetical protein ACR3K2_14040 [Cryptosporidium serpentis]
MVTKKIFREVTPNGSPLVQLQKDTYIVENFINSKDIIELKEGNMKNKVQVRCCQNSKISIGTKVNSIIADNCVGCIFLVNSVIASVEIVNCDNITIQVTGTVPTISIDKCNKVNIYVSEESKQVEIYSSKSGEMNLLTPGDEEGDWNEFVIPEQFVSRLNLSKGKIESVPSPLYG